MDAFLSLVLILELVCEPIQILVLIAFKALQTCLAIVLVLTSVFHSCNRACISLSRLRQQQVFNVFNYFSLSAFIFHVFVCISLPCHQGS